MENYKVFIKPSAKKELESLPKNDLIKIVEKIKNLSVDPRPHGAEKLSDDDKYRVRQGNYRIMYTIENEKLIIIVVKIGHRREVYRKR
ncbi:MAG: type II toxin-antitoxin system RelE/ParE family toxin [Calditrichaceae bacterium]|nr:type II toxin-antitoxin system RelE/ParE family toxin [Calditrichaceae bacterium]MBN2708378.1 type II toxin-antitoxin system RelE/ParE family toxin [Calditrichaceae bacterium]